MIYVLLTESVEALLSKVQVDIEVDSNLNGLNKGEFWCFSFRKKLLLLFPKYLVSLNEGKSCPCLFRKQSWDDESLRLKMWHYFIFTFRTHLDF